MFERVEEVGREAVAQAEAPASSLPTPARDVDVAQPRRVERELILRADALELVVEDAVAAADDRPVGQLVDGADARREVVACPA